MPVNLICPNGHRFTRPTTAHRKDGSRCPKCNAITFEKVLKVKAAKASPGTPRCTRNDKGGKHKPRVKAAPCPASTGCPQVPECIGCAYEPKPRSTTEAEELLLDAEETPSLRELFGPLDAELDDPDSPRHLGAVA